MFVAGLPVQGLLIVMATLASLLLVRRQHRENSVEANLWQVALVLLLFGLGITTFVEYWVLKNVDVGRMNTVFKFYNQVWILWALSASAATFFVFGRLRQMSSRLRYAWSIGAVAAIAAGAVYPVLATPARIQERFNRSVAGTLDGTAYMHSSVYVEHGAQIRLPYELDAIEWMQNNLTGSPIIGEVNTAPTLYGWGSRFSVYTGNPDIIGWDNHERQQRAAVPQLMISQRVDDVQKAYSTTDPALAYQIFKRYDARYFVVGDLERAYFPDGQHKWDGQEGCLWHQVYGNAAVRIYRVYGTPAARPGCGPN